MANTSTLANVTISKKEAWVYLTYAYVDTATVDDFVVYDSSVVATAAGDADPLTSNILEIYACSNAASTSRISLEWDATTEVTALDIPTQAGPVRADFRPMGGLPNQGGAGITGDILLNATGLGTGDLITVVLHVKRQ